MGVIRQYALGSRPRSVRVMEASERHAIIAALNNLAHYVEQGYPLEWTDPAPRAGRAATAKRTHVYCVGLNTLGLWSYPRRRRVDTQAENRVLVEALFEY